MDGNAPEPLNGIPSTLGLTTGEAYRKAEVDRRSSELVADLRERATTRRARTTSSVPPPTGRPATWPSASMPGRTSPSCSRATSCPPRYAAIWCPSSAKDRSTRTCSRIRSNRISEYLRGQGYRDAQAPIHERRPATGSSPSCSASPGRPVPQREGVDHGDHGDRGGRPAAAPARRARGPCSCRTPWTPTRRAIAEAYHRRGYTQVKVTPVVATVPGGGAPVPMDVRLEVERRPALGRRHDRHHRHTWPFRRRTCAPASARVTGQAYYQPQVALDRDGILLLLLNRGYQSATVEARVRVHRRPHARGSDVCRHRRPAGLRGSRADRRQRADEHRDDPPRGHAGAGAPLSYSRSRREPAAPQRARVVPSRADHRARSRRAEPPRRAVSRSRRRQPPRSAMAAASRAAACSARKSPAAQRRKCSRWRRAASWSSGGGTCSGRTSRSTCSPAPALRSRSTDHGVESRASRRRRGYTFTRLPRARHLPRAARAGHASRIC